jgi:VWFA-related protein
MGRSDAAISQWTIRKVVDEVAVFFGVTSGGHSVTGLELSDIKVLDDNKPPEKVLQFTPQSKLPLRLGVVIDTSGSVQPRFGFEKQAAAKFLTQMLTNSSDLGFVVGFAETPTVTQDFTGDHPLLAAGVNKLTNNGGTALFDAVSYACWKLAAYPEHERVAKVLVVVTDGEDNASHISLRQAIRDEEATGVTVYTISTKEGDGNKTEADKVLETLAERSGGEALFPGDMMTLGRSFDKLRDQIRSRYVVAYKPADFEANGKYRTITILAVKNGKRLEVHARKGYHARVETPTP